MEFRDSATLKTSFSWALVRVATYVAFTHAPPRLLFGLVSLLTKDRPKPTSGCGIDHFPVDERQRGKVFFRRVVLSAADAVEWYRSPSSNMCLTPIPSDASEVDPKLDGQRIMSSNFEDDPEWPSLGVPIVADSLGGLSGPGDPAPFVGSVPSRIHRRFGDSAGFDAVITNPGAVKFLKRRLHVDLADYPEYLGSLALVVPDPVIRRIDNFLVPDKESGSEKLVFRFVPRSDQCVDQLSMTVWEQRANLLSRFENIAVPPDGLVISQQNLPVDRSGYVVTHPIHGVLVHQPPLSFLRSINVSVGIVGRKASIEAPKGDSPNSPTIRYNVAEITHDTPMLIGDNFRPLGVTRVTDAEARREKRAQARRYDQTWFDDGDRDAAFEFIRSRVGRARRYVLIADPYFGARQIHQFLHAVSRIDVVLTIMTSRLAFEANSTYEIGPQAPMEGAPLAPEPPRDASASTKRSGSEEQRLKEFATSFATFEKRGIMNATALVLAGRAPPLHDRFLVIDDRVWFLGHSLNALGDRASLILQVPDPEPILKRLKEMTKNAMSFDHYIERRKRQSSRGGRKGGE